MPAQGPAGRGKPSLRRFDLKNRKEETLAEGIDDFKLSADGKKVLYRVGEPGGGGRPGRRDGDGHCRRRQIYQGGWSS